MKVPKRHQPIPVKTARRLAEHFGYRRVLILAIDFEDSVPHQHLTTYGETLDDKHAAASLGDALKAALGWPDDAVVHEDFRKEKE